MLHNRTYKIALRSHLVGSSGLCSYPSLLNGKQLRLRYWFPSVPLSPSSSYSSPYLRLPTLEPSVAKGSPYCTQYGGQHRSLGQPVGSPPIYRLSAVRALRALRNLTTYQTSQKVWLTPSSLVCLLLGCAEWLPPDRPISQRY